MAKRTQEQNKVIYRYIIGVVAVILFVLILIKFIK